MGLLLVELKSCFYLTQAQRVHLINYKDSASIKEGINSF